MKTKFSERLKELRAINNMSQQDLANAVNVCKSAVSAWEIGRNQPNYGILMDIAQYFDVSVDYLIGYCD